MLNINFWTQVEDEEGEKSDSGWIKVLNRRKFPYIKKGNSLIERI